MTRSIPNYVFFILLCWTAAAVAGPSDVLQDYVEGEDKSFEWSIEAIQSKEHLKYVVVDLQSLQWLDSEKVNRPVWQHWVEFYIPTTPAEDIALLYIGGGKNTSIAPSTPTSYFAALAEMSGVIVIHLGQVPNQSLMFANEPFPLREDALVAHSWSQYLATGEFEWIVQLPMVKSVIRAMDAATDVLAKEEVGNFDIKEFVVTGGSKRGWTTWLTAANDDRVVAVVPIVFDALNTQQSLLNHFQSFGYWSPALADYVAEGLLQKLGTAASHDLFAITDPYHSKQKLMMPKFMINSAGDQFFPNDSSHFYFRGLDGDKYLRYIPNSEHSLGGTDVNISVATFLWLVANQHEIPSFNWSWNEEGALLFDVQGDVIAVNGWEAYNAQRRDFRLLPTDDEHRIPRGPTWSSTTLWTSSSDHELHQVDWKFENQSEGWHARLIEVVFDVGFRNPFKLTSDIWILPQARPFLEKNHRLPTHVTINCVANSKEEVHEQIISYLKDTVETEYAEFIQVNGRDYYTWLPTQDIRIEGRTVGEYIKTLGYREADCSFQLEAGSKPTISKSLAN